MRNQMRPLPFAIMASMPVHSPMQGTRPTFASPRIPSAVDAIGPKAFNPAGAPLLKQGRFTSISNRPEFFKPELSVPVANVAPTTRSLEGHSANVAVPNRGVDVANGVRDLPPKSTVNALTNTDGAGALVNTPNTATHRFWTPARTAGAVALGSAAAAGATIAGVTLAQPGQGSPQQ